MNYQNHWSTELLKILKYWWIWLALVTKIMRTTIPTKVWRSPELKANWMLMISFICGPSLPNHQQQPSKDQNCKHHFYSSTKNRCRHYCQASYRKQQPIKQCHEKASDTPIVPISLFCKLFYNPPRHLIFLQMTISPTLRFQCLPLIVQFLHSFFIAYRPKVNLVIVPFCARYNWERVGAIWEAKHRFDHVRSDRQFPLFNNNTQRINFKMVHDKHSQRPIVDCI